MRKLQRILPIMLLLLLISSLIAPLGVQAVEVAVEVDVDTEPNEEETPPTTEVEVDENFDDLNKDTSDLTTDKDSNTTEFTYEATYSFYAEGKLKNNKNGKSQKDTMWRTILGGKEKSLQKEIEKHKSDKFTSSAIGVELDTDDGGSFWTTDTQALLDSATDTVFRVQGDGSYYYIKVPKPIKDSSGRIKNSAEIGYAIKAIEQYKRAVKYGVMLGTVDASYNVFRMYPKNQIALTDLLKSNPNKEKDGNMWIIGDGVGKMQYSLAYYFHPIFGKIPVEDLEPQKSGTGIKNDHLNKLATQIEIEQTDGDRGSYTVDSTYLGYIQGVGIEASILSSLKSGTVKGLEVRVNEYKTDWGNTKTSAKDLLESVFPILTPEMYNEVAANPNHYELKENGYKKVDGMYISVRNNYIMAENGDSYKITGGYATYGIDLNSLVLMGYTEEKDGEKAGGVTSLWFKEAMYDFAGTTGETKGFITGREVRFNNDYAKKMKIDESNVDLFALMTKRGGNISEPIRYYAFSPTSGDITTKEGNTSVGKKPESFKLVTSFETGINEGMSGFIMYRNYNYWNEEGLIKHLEAEEGMAGTDVEYDKLLTLIKGNFNVETAPLTYEEWVRVQKIKEDLDKSLGDYATTFINVICMIFAILLFFYSLILVSAYLIDCVGMLEFGLLDLVTFGRLRAIPFTLSKEELGMFDAFSSTEVKYVTWVGMVIYFIIFGVISVIFLYVQPIIQFIAYIFMRLSGAL